MPSVASARKFLHRWHAWVSTCDLQPMKKVAATIMAKADEILRSISSNLSNGLLEAINGNFQAAKRKAKGYRTKHNLKLMVYLIAGGVWTLYPLETATSHYSSRSARRMVFSIESKYSSPRQELTGHDDVRLGAPISATAPRCNIFDPVPTFYGGVTHRSCSDTRPACRRSPLSSPPHSGR
jgi:hypothetical protein